MYEIKQTTQFSSWLKKLKDVKGKVSIIRRIDRIRVGNFGDHKSVGENISELRFSTGPAYRVYYTKVKDKIVLLLIAGDKSSQKEDIRATPKIIVFINSSEKCKILKNELEGLAGLIR